MALVCSICGVEAQGIIGKSVSGTDKRHKKCGEGAVVMLGNIPKIAQKTARVAAGKKKAAARKELTGRSRQGNHDSLTKPVVRGGYRGDQHANGVRQNGSAGGK